MSKFKDQLIEEVSFMDEAQAEMIGLFVNMISSPSVTKGDLMKMAYGDTSNVDSAVPNTLPDEVRDLGVEYRNSFNVMSYKGTSPRVQNLGERIVLRMMSKF